MAHPRVSVKQIDVQRSVKGALAAGLPVGRVEVDLQTGRVVIYPSAESQQAGPNEWDEVLK